MSGKGYDSDDLLDTSSDVSMEDLIDSPRRDNLVLLGRRASKLHMQMVLFPGTLVKDRIRPSIILPQMKIQQRCWFFALLMCIIALPLGYANILMPYPCKAQEVLQKTLTAKKEVPMLVRQTDCDVEDHLMDIKSGLIDGILLVVAALILTIVMSILNNIFLWCECYMLKHYLWRPLLLFWYRWVGPQMDRLKYANDGQIFPPLYTPVSVVICWMYIITFLELLYTGWDTGHPGTGAVLGYALAQAVVKIADAVMGGAEEVVLVVDGHIKNWKSPKDLSHTGPGKTRTVLDKLRAAVHHQRTSVTLTDHDLEDLEQLGPLGEEDGSMNARLGADGSVAAVGLLTTVFIFSSGEIVNLRSGRVYPSQIAKY